MFPWHERFLFRERTEDRKRRFKEIGQKVYEFFDETATAAGYQMRIGQLDMACDIVDGLCDKKHVLVEASVGIGKSFAYIVPVLCYIREYGRPVVIATSTIALQEQLKNDIEIIKQMLGMHTDVLIAKGQTHFLCRKRMDECFTKNFINMTEENQEIYTVISKSGYERADWNVSIPEEIWNKINVKEFNLRYCRETCSYHDKCHYYTLRQEMLDTLGIIVCNQDLLAVSMRKKSMKRSPLMSKDIGLIVIDEAHNLESRVRSSVTTFITMRNLKENVYEASRAIDVFDESFTAEVDMAEKLIDKAFRLLYKQMVQQDKIAEENGQDIERYYVRQSSTVFHNLQKTLANICDKASLAFGAYDGDKHHRNYDEEIEKLEDCVEFLTSFVRGTQSDDIFWMECPKGNKSVKGVYLYKCPKEVNKITKNILFKEEDIQIVLTSATLTSGRADDYRKDYLYFMKNTGFALDQGYICEPKESPFNYDEHAMIYYTENLPHPSKERKRFIEEAVKEIIRLLHISVGKALILFTAKTDMQEVYEKLLEEELPFQIFMQLGNEKQAETLEKFRKDTNSVLLGTGSFWEGINIEGISLSHVIIFKLPFPVREPIIDYKYSQSKNGLMEVSVPEMVIKLKQGIGRLIRSESDKGIVSIIDSRVGINSKAPYKEIIWESLPIKNRTNNIEEIKRFYESVVRK